MPPQARAVVMALQECPWCCSLLTVTVPSQESQAWNMGRPESCLAQVNDLTSPGYHMGKQNRLEFFLCRKLRNCC